LSQSSEQHGARCSGARTVAAAMLAAVLLLMIVPGLHAQGDSSSVFERLGLDRLRFSAIGVEAGIADPVHVIPTQSYAVHADYGEIAPHWRVSFSASYWGSRYTDETVNQYLRALGRVIIDPSADDTIPRPTITISDVALEMDVRWFPLRHTFARPFAGVGFGAHVLNAESPFIAGTFVESALDNISMGIAASVGVEMELGSRLSFGGQARYTMLSPVRFGAFRAMASYHFGVPTIRPGTTQ
jgi:hypothetical protein